jgi:Ran GTPase-activating protein (RanGAP) involved in mRNA processing and transport
MYIALTRCLDHSLDGLQEAKRDIATLSLRQCGISSKGFKSLQTLLQTPLWMQGLKVLDVSQNAAGKEGTKALATWLGSPEVTLEQLHVTQCDLDLEALLKAITNNRKLYDQHLRVLNISGNKIGKKTVPLILTLLINTGSMSQMFFSSCSLTRQAFVDIIDAALQNDRGLHFSLDFSNNELGPKGGKELGDLYAKWLKKTPSKITTAGNHSTCTFIHTQQICLIPANNGMMRKHICTSV